MLWALQLNLLSIYGWETAGERSKLYTIKYYFGIAKSRFFEIVIGWVEKFQVTESIYDSMST